MYRSAGGGTGVQGVIQEYEGKYRSTEGSSVHRVVQEYRGRIGGKSYTN